MKLIPIFEVNKDTKEGLYTIQYNGQADNEFDRLFNLWTNDREYILNYLASNQPYLEDDYFKGESINNIRNRIRKEAMELLELLNEYSDAKGEKKLQEVFRPLSVKSEREFIIPVHQRTKISIQNWKYRNAILRIYAIRVGPSTYVITGGAIKLTRKMQEHEDTRQELEKFETVKRYLRSIELYNEDDLMYIL